MQTILSILTLLFLSSEPANDVDYIYEINGYIEINTFISEDDMIKNRFILTQALVRKWIPQLGQHHVVHFLLVDKDYVPSSIKLPNGKIRVVLRSKNSSRFVIDCDSIKYTITPYDPELLDRDKLPRDKRRLHFNSRIPYGIQRFKDEHILRR